MSEVLEFYPEDKYNVHILTINHNKMQIYSFYKAKTSPCFGAGKIGNTGYYLLAEFSPVHFGDKSTVFICLLSDLNIIEMELK